MPERRRRLARRLLPAALLGLGFAACYSFHRQLGADPPRTLDPAAWGSDHVGQPVPAFVEGNECLFCHRFDVGTTWESNRHSRTVREVDPEAPALQALRQSPGLEALAGQATLIMGNDRRQRFLRPAQAYGRLEMLSVEWEPPRGDRPGTLLKTEGARWDPSNFADSCAGCHATGVDPQTRSFLSPSLDCSACHGEVPAGHSKDPALAYLSPRRKDPARVTISICAQCHARTGTSRSTNRPYPNNFVAGDNLFRDFRVDFSDEAISRLVPGDRHILENVRAVVVEGRDGVTCLSCHDVHKQSTRKHHVVPQGAACLTCHNETGPKKSRKPYAVHSRICGY